MSASSAAASAAMSSEEEKMVKGEVGVERKMENEGEAKAKVCDSGVWLDSRVLASHEKVESRTRGSGGRGVEGGEGGVGREKELEEEEGAFGSGEEDTDEEGEELDLHARRVAAAREHVSVMIERVRELDRARAHMRRSGDLLPIPKSVIGRLLPHQVSGVKFVCEQLVAGLGTVLADEQGLGKTIQAISALLCCAQHSEQVCTDAVHATQFLHRSSNLLPHAVQPPSDPSTLSLLHPPAKYLYSLPHNRTTHKSSKTPTMTSSSSSEDDDDDDDEEEEGREEDEVGGWGDGGGREEGKVLHPKWAARLGGPYLIVVPTSTLGNWGRELSEWAPSFRVWELVGSAKDRQALARKLARYMSRSWKEGNRAVVLTTYTMLDNDKTLRQLCHAVGDRGFGVMVLDEAHCLKNPHTSRFRRITAIPSARRILLTGTPVQNNLNELLSLLAVFLSDVIDVKRAHLGGLVKADGSDEAWSAASAVAASNAFLTNSLWDAFCDAVREELKSTSSSSSSSSSPSQPTTLPSSSAIPSKTVPQMCFGKVTTPHGEATVLRLVDHEERSGGKEEGDFAQIRETFGRFFLRRTKEQVLDLPPKIVSVVEAEMLVEQRRIYDSLVKTTRGDGGEWGEVLVGGVNDAFTVTRGMSLPYMTIVAGLRKTCNHPLLLRTRYSDAAVLDIAQVIRAAEIGAVPSEALDAWDEARQTVVSAFAEEGGGGDEEGGGGDEEGGGEVGGVGRSVGDAVVSYTPLSLSEGCFPVPLTSDALLVWSRGDTRLVRVAEQMLREWSDFELAQVCEEYPCLGTLRLDARCVDETGKLKLLDRLIRRGDDKILVFSQFTRVLDLIQAHLHRLDVKFVRLDGATRSAERQERIDLFNSTPSIRVFLLSTRAGGIGLNLTAANVVFLHDPDLNPAADRQAEDRCHRIGQKRPVQVLKLVAKRSVERRILDLAQNKALLHSIIAAESTTAKRGPKRKKPDQEELARFLLNDPSD